MLITQTIEPHGPDHYRQLLERADENEILKPNRAKATLKNINRERQNWDRCVPALSIYGC